MKILQLLANGHVGGTESFVISLVEGLVQRGDDVTLANAWTDSPINEAARSARVPFVALSAGTYRIGVRWMRTVGQYLRAHRFDIVQTYGLRVSLAVRLMQHRLRLTHHVTGVRGLDRQRTGIQAFLDRRTEHRLDLLICNAQAVARRRMSLVGTPSHRIRVIPNGIDTSLFNPDLVAPPRSHLGLPDGFLFLTVASFRSEKDHHNLLQAIVTAGNELANAQFVFVGEGQLRTDVQARVRQLNLTKRVHLVGSLSDVRPYVRSCDAFVLPSHSEGMPRALMEAMALGKPVVATAAGGVPEVALHERDALVVPIRDSRALADALIRVHRDAELRRRLAAAAARRIRTDYSHTTMLDRHVQTYHEILRDKGTESQ